MYAEKLNKFENAENLAGKAWQHAVNCDLLEQVKFKDCSMHCCLNICLKRVVNLGHIRTHINWIDC